LNKKGAKVNKAQLRNNEMCLNDFQKGKLVGEMTFDECTRDDRRDNVRNAGKTTIKRDVKKCESLDVLPPFAYTGAETVNVAAVVGAQALTYELFGGPPVLDADVGLPTSSDELEAAQCQLEMLKSAGKLEKIVLKQVNKAKKRALKDEAVDSAAALENELMPVFASDDKISRAESKLVKSVDKKCDDLDESLDTVFAGSCGDPVLSDVEDCVIAVARCQACLKINAFDDLNLDCDQADDQNANGSCP
jgi:hypothetical protein